MEFNYSDQELKHSEILEKVAKPCHSNKTGFKETEKLDEIRKLLVGSGYHEVLLPQAQIWRKNFSSPVNVLVSSHADFVSQITKPFSTLSENGYYKGTYDNAGTTGAAVIAMLEGDIPDNVVFAFTADEETGRCNGAREALEYVNNLGNDPLCIALDVTYEGYDNGELFTVENLSSGNKKNEDQEFLCEVAKTMLSLEPEDKKTCSFVRLHKNGVPDNLPSKYIAKDCGWFDEAQFYAKENVRAFSLCLPSDGNMHGNSGLQVRQPGFEGYVNSLEAMIYTFSLDKELSMELVAEKRLLNAELFEKCEDLVIEEEKAEAERIAKSKPKYSYGSSSWRYNKILDSSIARDDSYWEYLRQSSTSVIPKYNPDQKYEIEYPESYIDSWYDESVFGDFKEYVDSIIEDIVVNAYEYDESELDMFLSDVEMNLPEDFVDYYGGPDKTRKAVIDMFYASIETYDPDISDYLSDRNKKYDNYDEDEISTPKNQKLDKDGYEYEYTLDEYLMNQKIDREREDEIDLIAKNDDKEEEDDEEYDYSGYYE